MTIKTTMNVGLLKRFLDNYFDDIKIAVRVPGGGVFEIVGATMKSAGAETPLVFELLTEKDLDTKKIVAIRIGEDHQPDYYQP